MYYLNILKRIQGNPEGMIRENRKESKANENRI